MMDDDSLLIPENESGTAATIEGNSDQDQVNDDDCLYIEETLKNFTRIGITLIVLGVVSTTVSIIAACEWHGWAPNYHAGIAICGIFALVTGSLAITLRFHLTYGVVIANLVASILAVICGLLLIILAALSGANYQLYPATRSLSLFACIVVVAWTTLCAYHGIIVTRILLKYKPTHRPACCPGPFAPSYAGMAMACVPGSRLPDGNQAVFMAVPATGMASQGNTFTTQQLTAST